jgi:hypothetical protein
MTLDEWQKKPRPCLDIDYLMDALGLTATEARALIFDALAKPCKFGVIDGCGQWLKFPKIPAHNQNTSKIVV